MKCPIVCWMCFWSSWRFVALNAGSVSKRHKCIIDVLKDWFCLTAKETPLDGDILTSSEFSHFAVEKLKNVPLYKTYWKRFDSPKASREKYACIRLLFGFILQTDCQVLPVIYSLRKAANYKKNSLKCLKSQVLSVIFKWSTASLNSAYH